VARLDIQLINLGDSHDRLASSTLVLDGMGLAFERLAAFDGRGLPVSDLPGYHAEGAIRVVGRDLTGGEVGCYLSHVQAAEQFLRGQGDFGLVLEDDFGVTPESRETLAALVAWLDGHSDVEWDLVNLGETTRRHVLKIAGYEHPNALLRSFYLPMTTTAILWSRQGATRFLQAALPIRMPIDHFLRHWAAKTGLGLSLERAIFPARGVESIIDRGTPRRRVRRNFRSWIAKHRELSGTKWQARRTMSLWQKRT